MKYTVEQKLEKALDFIRRIERFDFPLSYADSLVSVKKCECNECGSDDCSVDLDDNNEEVLTQAQIDALKDEAWHLLADLSD